MAPAMFGSIAWNSCGQNLTAKLIIGQRRGLSFIASRQLVSSKQELNSTDLES